MRTDESVTPVRSFVFCEQAAQQVWCTLCGRSHTPPRACRCRRCCPHLGTSGRWYGGWISSPYSRSRNAPSQLLLQSTCGEQEHMPVVFCDSQEEWEVQLKSSLLGESVARTFTVRHIHLLLRLTVTVINMGFHGYQLACFVFLHTCVKILIISLFLLAYHLCIRNENTTLTDFTAAVCISLNCVLRKKRTKRQQNLL